MGDFSRMLGLGTLASLPLWLGMIGVILAARDLTEMAAAAIAAAIAITLAGIAALTIVTRRSSRIAQEHDIYVRQSLALVDCMKEINRRVMQIEAREASTTDMVEAALSIETDLAPPDAMNDAPETAELPEVAAPPKAVAAPEPIPDLLPDPMPEPTPDPMPVLPAPPQLAELPLCELASGDVAGSRLALAEPLGSDIEAVLLLATLRGRAPGQLLELMLPAEARTRSLLLCALAVALPEAPALAANLTLGVSEPQLKAGSAEEMRLIATLVQAGLKLSLHDVADLDLSGERLAASGIARVTMDANWLTGRLAAEPDKVARWSADLVGHGVTLAAINVPHRRMALLLAAFDVTLGTGPGAAEASPEPAPAPHSAPAAPAEEAFLLPWRAAPRRKAG
jgi:hypothetical protein